MRPEELVENLLPLAHEAQGRCHSCANQRTFELPDGPLFHCRAYQLRMDASEREAVRDCERWAPFRPTDGVGRKGRSDRNPLFAAVVEAEDHLFWALKQYLVQIGVDLKTVLVLAQPGLSSTEDVKWVDKLENRFGDDEDCDLSLEEIIAELRALRYDHM